MRSVIRLHGGPREQRLVVTYERELLCFERESLTASGEWERHTTMMAIPAADASKIGDIAAGLVQIWEEKRTAEMDARSKV